MQIRVLCLGNDLMADDAVGPAVARRLRELRLPGVEVVETPESGLRLLDFLDAERLLIVDAVSSGGAPPGTVYHLEPQNLPAAPGVSPHYAGLQEALLVGRALGVEVSSRVSILAVETADCTSIGGPMHPAVEQAAARIVGIIARETGPPAPAPGEEAP